MILEKELLQGKDFNILNDVQKNNLPILLYKINLVREKRGLPMTVTSGVRFDEDHIRIYKELALKRGIVFDPKQIPWGSMHLKAGAVDIADPDGSLYQWCVDNEAWLKSIGLWIEKKDDQKRVHFQIYKYGSYTEEKSIFFAA